jgi:hypothetical protein
MVLVTKLHSTSVEVNFQLDELPIVVGGERTSQISWSHRSMCHWLNRFLQNALFLYLLEHVTG